MNFKKTDELTVNICAALLVMVLFTIPCVQIIYYLSFIPGYSRFIKLKGLVTQSLKQNIYTDDTFFETKTTIYQTTFSIYDLYSNTTSCLISKSEKYYKLSNTYYIYLNTKSIDYFTHSAECVEYPSNRIITSILLVIFLLPTIAVFGSVIINLYKKCLTNLNKKNDYTLISQVEMI